MNHEVEVIQFTSESNQIHVQLPKTDVNLDIMINITQGMKQNNGNNGRKPGVIKQLNNDLIKSSDDEIIKKNSLLENQVKELVDDLQLQKDADEVTTSIQSEPFEHRQGPDETLKRPSKGLDKSLTKDQQRKKPSGKKGGFPYVLPDDQVLVKNKDTATRNISVYKPVVKYLMESLDDEFVSRDIRDGIFYCFNNMIGRKLKKSSAHTYVADYREYLVDMGFIEQFEHNKYRFTEEGKKKRVKKTDDADTTRGRPSISKKLQDAIKKMSEQGFSNDEIKENIFQRFQVALHRNTISRYKSDEVKKKRRKSVMVS